MFALISIVYDLPCVFPILYIIFFVFVFSFQEYEDGTSVAALVSPPMGCDNVEVAWAIVIWFAMLKCCVGNNYNNQYTDTLY